MTGLAIKNLPFYFSVGADKNVLLMTSMIRTVHVVYNGMSLKQRKR